MQLHLLDGGGRGRNTQRPALMVRGAGVKHSIRTGSACRAGLGERTPTPLMTVEMLVFVAPAFHVSVFAWRLIVLAR